MALPEIRIKQSFLLNNKLIPLLKPELEQAGRLQEADDEYISQKADEYKAAWAEYEDRIIPALCNVLDLEFKQNIIDIYVAPFHNSFSDPMVISTKYSNDRVVDVITHEISHRLLTDNNKLPMRDGRKISQHWTELFGNHSYVALTHIPVHALLEYIYVDVLSKPTRLQHDIDFCNNFEPYRQAWEYVQRTGYEEIIKKLRMSYDS